MKRPNIKDTIARSITLLPREQQLVISLFYEHGLTFGEVGEVLGMNPHMVCRLYVQAFNRVIARRKCW